MTNQFQAMKKLISWSIVLISLCFIHDAIGQKKAEATDQNQDIQEDQYKDGLVWRNVGPHRGGRSTAVCGVIQDKDTYYMGTTGGGVWKTTDGGATWKNISDGFFETGSVGAVAVSASDPSVIYVGMGEAPIRGVMTSHGNGVYKSTDAGETWTHMGLDKVRQISKVRIDPNNDDIVYVSAQGSPYMPTEDRGVYKSSDGGATWKKVLFVNERSGACDLSLDMNNSRVLFAAFWDHQRLPWKMVSGGEGSGIWKSKDAGETWEELTEGLPKAIMGKIGVSVSGANSQRVYAIIESDEGGLYRSDDGGNSWSLMNEDRVLRARSWYYMHIFADPVDEDKVVVLNAPFMQSLDGGKSFTRIMTPHGDNHDLWINPTDPEVMINANDGGGNISYNAGKNWTIQSNQPTAQFYRVSVDNQFPYRIYGGQQDNSTVSIPNQVAGGGIRNEDFYSVGGCESAFCAFDPDHPNLVYAGCYQGIISEYNVELKTSKDIMAYPILGLGTRPLDRKYRFNWNAPIVVSQHDPSTIYHGGQLVLVSRDRGITWEELSPDLTKPDSSQLDYGGGPITREGAGGEVYHTLMYIAESPHDPQVMYTGSDDGQVHVTRDGGENWTNITPKGLPEGMINSIEVSPHDQGTVYIAFNRYKFNDFTPYIYISRNFGKSWKNMASGIADEAHVRVVREDPERKDLLYAGTETGLYVSFNGGMNWDRFQLNLPVVPITDMVVHQGDLVVATQGRAFWVLDEITPIRKHDPKMDEGFMAYKPLDVYQFGGARNDKSLTAGTNPDYGLVSYYKLGEGVDSLEITAEIMDDEGQLVRTFKTNAKDKKNMIKAGTGLNKLVWDLKREDKPKVQGLFPFGGFGGAEVPPGRYTIKYSTDQGSEAFDFVIHGDPRLDLELSDFDEKRIWLKELDTISRSIYHYVNDLSRIKGQVKSFIDREGLDSTIVKQGKSIIKSIDKIDGQLVQRKQKTFQDVINYPNMLDANIKAIEGSIAGAVPPLTSGQKMRAGDLKAKWIDIENEIQKLYQSEIQEFNRMVREASIPLINSKMGMKKA